MGWLGFWEGDLSMPLLEKQMDSCISRCCVALQERELFHVLVLHKDKKPVKKGKNN